MRQHFLLDTFAILHGFFISLQIFDLSSRLPFFVTDTVTLFMSLMGTCRLGFQNLNFVIRHPDGSPLRPDLMTRKWIQFVEKNNLPRIRLHDLRHSHATALIMAGVNPKVVRQRMGHSDVNITLNTYTHVLPEMVIAAAELLDNIILKKA